MTTPHKRNRPVVVATLDQDMIEYLNEESERRRTSVSAIIREALLPVMEADQRGAGNVAQQAVGRKIVQEAWTLRERMGRKRPAGSRLT